MGVWIETSLGLIVIVDSIVTPCVGVWIETDISAYSGRIDFVTPCVGVWIETLVNPSGTNSVKSHPAWVCGLKQ